MRIAIFADIHARGKDAKALAAQCGAAAGAVRTKDIDLVTFVGDVFDAPNIGDSRLSTGGVVAIMQRFVADLIGGQRQVLMIVGNHDQAGSGSQDALHVFDEIPGVHIVREPENIFMAGCEIACLPWSWAGAGNDPAEELARLASERKGKKFDLLLGHVQVVGAKMNSHVTCEASPGKWQIDRETLSAFPARHIALGDFHLRHDLTNGRGGYVGAFRNLSHNEEGNPAGFEIWDSVTGETEWVELDAAPKYQTIPVASLDEPAPSGYDLKNTVTRVDFGIDPDPAEVARLEAMGVEVRIIKGRDERIVRAVVDESIVHNARGLIDLWAKAQNPPVTPERMTRMSTAYDRMVADAQPAEV